MVTIPRARRLRREATLAEIKLWWQLRTLRPLGYHFRRQPPFRSYILDFVEHNRKVVIELDGGQHAEPEQKRKDEIRDRILARDGYLVLGFDNGGVLSDMEGTVDYILRMIEQRPPTRIAARSDLPTRGR